MAFRPFRHRDFGVELRGAAGRAVIRPADVQIRGGHIHIGPREKKPGRRIRVCDLVFSDLLIGLRGSGVASFSLGNQRLGRFNPLHRILNGTLDHRVLLRRILLRDVDLGLLLDFVRDVYLLIGNCICDLDALCAGGHLIFLIPFLRHGHRRHLVFAVFQPVPVNDAVPVIILPGLGFSGRPHHLHAEGRAGDHRILFFI